MPRRLIMLALCRKVEAEVMQAQEVNKLLAMNSAAPTSLVGLCLQSVKQYQQVLASFKLLPAVSACSHVAQGSPNPESFAPPPSPAPFNPLFGSGVPLFRVSQGSPGSPTMHT